MKSRYIYFAFFLATGVVLCLVPFIVSNFVLRLLIRIMFYSMLAMSFSLLAGQLGLVSLMIPAFFGISGYMVAILETKGILAFPYSVLLGLLASTAIAGLFGLVVNRTKGIYYLMLTLVLGQLVWALALQMVFITKGTTGIINVYAPTVAGISFEDSNTAFYFAQLSVFAICIVALLALIRSPFGLKLRGIKESESRMIILGYNVQLIKWTAFVISSFIAALGGVFFTYFTGLMNPDSISLMAAVQIMLASILGGVNSILGVILGTTIVKILEIVLSRFTQRYVLIIGVLFLLVVSFMPEGIMGSIKKGFKSIALIIKGVKRLG